MMRCHNRFDRISPNIGMMEVLRSIACVGLISFLGATAAAQSPTEKFHYFQRSDMPPGTVGSAQLLRGGPVVGYFQPLEISGPKGLQVALAQSGQFLETLEAPVRAGMLIGSVYRIRVTQIPNLEGQELYPTIEVIDRLYAPDERAHRFPIPVVLDQEDLEAALSGRMVTRVIYVEDNELAPPVSDKPGEQRVMDSPDYDDPLRLADQMGRPVAIVRIGSRVPDSQSSMDHFLFGSPPWMPIKPIPERQKLIENGMWPDVQWTPAPPEPRRQPIVPGSDAGPSPSGDSSANRNVGRISG